MTWEDVRKSEIEKIKTFINQYKDDGYSVDNYVDYNINIGMKINEDVLNNLLPGMSFDRTILPFGGMGGSFSNSEFE